MRHLVRPRAKCTTCRQDYDEADGEARASQLARRLRPVVPP